MLMDVLLCCPRICNAIVKSHPQRSEAHKFDLDKSLPSIQDIQNSLLKIRQICVIGEKLWCVCVCVCVCVC